MEVRPDTNACDWEYTVESWEFNYQYSVGNFGWGKYLETRAQIRWGLCNIQFGF